LAMAWLWWAWIRYDYGATVQNAVSSNLWANSVHNKTYYVVLHSCSRIRSQNSVSYFCLLN
jgi:hypothetical protein